MSVTETVRAVIDLAQKANRARTQRASVEGAHPYVTSGFPSVGTATATGLPLPTQEEADLFDYLRVQDSKTLSLLTGLMYLGRGDFDESRLRNYSVNSGPRWAAAKLADTVPLAQYLQQGLKKASAVPIDLDAL